MFWPDQYWIIHCHHDLNLCKGWYAPLMWCNGTLTISIRRRLEPLKQSKKEAPWVSAFSVSMVCFMRAICWSTSWSVRYSDGASRLVVARGSSSRPTLTRYQRPTIQWNLWAIVWIQGWQCTHFQEQNTQWGTMVLATPIEPWKGSPAPLTVQLERGPNHSGREQKFKAPAYIDECGEVTSHDKRTDFGSVSGGEGFYGWWGAHIKPISVHTLTKDTPWDTT